MVMTAEVSPQLRAEAEPGVIEVGIETNGDHSVEVIRPPIPLAEIYSPRTQQEQLTQPENPRAVIIPINVLKTYTYPDGQELRGVKLLTRGGVVELWGTNKETCVTVEMFTRVFYYIQNGHRQGKNG